MPRDQRAWETTSSPISNSWGACRGPPPKPPPSTSSVLPSGVISSRESPWPTSMASTSSALSGCWIGRGATAAKAASNKAAQAMRRGQQRAEGGRLPEQRGRNSVISKGERAEQPHQPHTEMEKHRHHHCRRHGCGRPYE